MLINLENIDRISVNPKKLQKQTSLEILIFILFDYKVVEYNDIM